MRIKSIRQYRVSRKMAGRALSHTESRSLLSVCDDDSKESVRDRAILLLLLGCGLRRAEITKIEIRNVFLEEGRIRLIGKPHFLKQCPSLFFHLCPLPFLHTDRRIHDIF